MKIQLTLTTRTPFLRYTEVGNAASISEKLIKVVLADMATVFKKGLMYKGIYWPSLTNSFHSKRLEFAYLQYSHRQRQKSLIIVNIADLLLKVSSLKSSDPFLAVELICLHVA